MYSSPSLAVLNVGQNPVGRGSTHVFCSLGASSLFRVGSLSRSREFEVQLPGDQVDHRDEIGDG